MRQLAFILSKYNLRVNAFAPGPAATELWDGLPSKAREGLFKEAANKPITHRGATPEEVAQICFGLLKDSKMTRLLIIRRVAISGVRSFRAEAVDIARVIWSDKWRHFVFCVIHCVGNKSMR